MINTKHSHIKRYVSLGITIALVIGLVILLFFVNPKELVELIGVRNSYIIIFFFAIFGGVSSFTSTSFYATIVTFAVGGANPFLLGVITGCGMTIGDSVFFFLGVHGREAFLQKYEKKIDKTTKWLEQRPRWMMPVIIYGYTGFTPFPGDLLMIALAVIRYPYKKLVVPMMLGNITLLTILGVLGHYGISLVAVI